MSISDILIILACLAGGYWIVSSVMGPGVDITRRSPPPAEPPADPPTPAHETPPSWASVPKARASANPRERDWHLLLDVSRSASKAEIEAAYKRQLNKALAGRDSHQQEQLRLAREAALSHLSLPPLR
jgi:hypothetical protein